MADNDLMEADYWAGMAFSLDNSDESLIRQFRKFSLRADMMLLEDWQKQIKDYRANPRTWMSEENVARFEKIVGMLELAISEKEKTEGNP